MRLALLLGLLSLSLAGTWLVVYDRIDAHVRHELDRMGMAEVLTYDELSVELPASAALRGGTLRDPHNGRVIARVERVDVSYELPWRDGQLGFVLTELRGQGGRVLLRYEDGELGIVRAVDTLIQRILDQPTSGADVPYPRLSFEDLEIVVHTPGEPLERYPGASLRIDLSDEGAVVDLLAGPGAGRLLMEFDEFGMRRFESQGLRISPAVTALDPHGRDVLQRGFTPGGHLDLVALTDPRGLAQSAHGLLRDAFVDCEYVPFRLESESIPFDVVDGVLEIKDAVMGFEGGQVVVNLQAAARSSELVLDVQGAEFRESLTHLIPGFEVLEGLECEDGGQFACRLVIDIDGEEEEQEVEVQIEGEGGFHVERARLQPYGLVFEDVVGRFDADETSLSFSELSAQFFAGELRAAGTLNLRDDSFQMTASLEDVDARELHEALRPYRGLKHDVAGWLQGDVRARGVVGEGDALVADGQLSVRAGNFWETPTIEAILEALTLSDTKHDHQRIEMQYTVRGRQVYVAGLKMVSDALSLAGQGRIGFDGRIEFELVPVTVPLGLLGDLLDALQQGLLVNLVVTGTLDDPRVIAMPVSVVTNPLRKLLEYLAGEDDG